MKASKFLAAIMLMFVCSAMAINFTSCGDDDDDDNGSSHTYQKLCSGTWVNGIYSYSFNSGGTGFYHVGSSQWADFKYTIDGRSVTMTDFTFVNSDYGSVWHSEGIRYGTYDLENDTFRVDGKVYTRKQ